MATRARKLTNIIAAETCCHSLPDIKKANQEDITREEIPALNGSSNVYNANCQSILDLEEPLNV